MHFVLDLVSRILICAIYVYVTCNVIFVPKVFKKQVKDRVKLRIPFPKVELIMNMIFNVILVISILSNKFTNIIIPLQLLRLIYQMFIFENPVYYKNRKKFLLSLFVFGSLLRFM